MGSEEQASKLLYLVLPVLDIKTHTKFYYFFSELCVSTTDEAMKMMSDLRKYAVT